MFIGCFKRMLLGTVLSINSSNDLRGKFKDGFGDINAQNNHEYVEWNLGREKNSTLFYCPLNGKNPHLQMGKTSVLT